MLLNESVTSINDATVFNGTHRQNTAVHRNTATVGNGIAEDLFHQSSDAESSSATTAYNQWSFWNPVLEDTSAIDSTNVSSDIIATEGGYFPLHPDSDSGKSDSMKQGQSDAHVPNDVDATVEYAGYDMLGNERSFEIDYSAVCGSGDSSLNYADSSLRETTLGISSGEDSSVTCMIPPNCMDRNGRDSCLHGAGNDYDTNHDWDIKNIKLAKITKFDSYDIWPDGNIRRVYKQDNERARRHQSGWAMRNTNNHNPQVLKKSCLGILECSSRCQPNGKPLYLRPAICDKARRKQCMRPCLTSGCKGNLVQRVCKGHGGYPVTHFWRFANGAVYFEAKGSHDHPRPAVKCLSVQQDCQMFDESRLFQSYSISTMSYGVPNPADLFPDIKKHRNGKSTKQYRVQSKMNKKRRVIDNNNSKSLFHHPEGEFSSNLLIEKSLSLSDSAQNYPACYASNANGQTVPNSNSDMSTDYFQVPSVVPFPTESGENVLCLPNETTAVSYICANSLSQPQGVIQEQQHDLESGLFNSQGASDKVSSKNLDAIFSWRAIENYSNQISSSAFHASNINKHEAVSMICPQDELAKSDPTNAAIREVASSSMDTTQLGSLALTPELFMEASRKNVHFGDPYANPNYAAISGLVPTSLSHSNYLDFDMVPVGVGDQMSLWHSSNAPYSVSSTSHSNDLIIHPNEHDKIKRSETETFSSPNKHSVMDLLGNRNENMEENTEVSRAGLDCVSAFVKPAVNNGESTADVLKSSPLSSRKSLPNSELLALGGDYSQARINSMSVIPPPSIGSLYANAPGAMGMTSNNGPPGCILGDAQVSAQSSDSSLSTVDSNFGSLGSHDFSSLVNCAITGLDQASIIHSSSTLQPTGNDLDQFNTVSHAASVESGSAGAISAEGLMHMDPSLVYNSWAVPEELAIQAETYSNISKYDHSAIGQRSALLDEQNAVAESNSLLSAFCTSQHHPLNMTMVGHNTGN